MVEAILITGMSGVGKTTAIQALRALGHHAIDMDEGDPELIYFLPHGRRG